ncbi:phosphatidic acid phosphatase type 2/haloperoxidase [Scenedesmus sp. NREL 46B-D3]|nr:phosphatidic acid phosphatase type 2/haloperoxidase [Scenedesmus sp. NREL 46B-D3]
MQRSKALPLGLRCRAATMSAVRWLLLAGYIWDWLLAVTLIIVNFTIPGEVIPPLERMWFPNDPTLSYPPTRSWLSERGKFPVEFGIPLLVTALAQVHSRSLLDWHHFALALIEAFAIESSFKKWMNLVGKPRPDWYARVATGDPAVMRDGRTSYPSGHAAETFMAFGLLSLYLMAKLKLFTRQSQGHFAKVMLCLLPLGFAAFITMSRVAAYKHDFADVNAGMLIGLCSGVLAYLINYKNPLCHETAARPRVRPIPATPAWLKQLLGADAEVVSNASMAQEAGLGEHDARDPLLGPTEAGAAWTA